MSVRISFFLFAALSLAGCQTLGGEDAPQDPVEQTKEEQSARLVEIAQGSMQRGDAATAAQMYQRASTLTPGDPEITLALAQSLAADKRFREADSLFERASSLLPNDVRVLREHGKVLLQLDKTEIARQKYSAAVQLAPNDPRLHNGLGVALDLAGDRTGAQDRYRQGLKVAPTYVPLKNNLALSLALEGQFEAAIALLAPLAEAPLASMRNRQNLALIHGLAGNVNEAARIAAKDLGPEAVDNNLAAYERLRSLSEDARTKAVFQDTASE